MRQTYVFGHRNPDTDSIVSAIAYAALKRQQGLKTCLPARAGKLTPQTEYILQRFGVHAPKFIPDMLPKVMHFVNDKPETIHEGASLRDALELMDHAHLGALPVVDTQGHYASLLTHYAFAENIVQKTDPHRKAIIPTSIDLLVHTLQAQPLLSFNPDTIAKSRILVAGSSKDAFDLLLKSEVPVNAIALVEDREDIIKLCIARKLRAIILTSGVTLSKALRAEAEAAQVSVMISPYDIASTIFLVLYAMPVSMISSTQIPAVPETALVRDIFSVIQASPSRRLAVVDSENRVVGVIHERDLYKEPNVDIIMVDHNELAQAVEGLERFRIIEIIDHHKLGNFPTHVPITFINRVVGSTSTVVACLYLEQKARMTLPVAGILLSGIITDTLGLKSATTTDIDRNIAEYLSSVLNLEIDELARDIFSHANTLADMSIDEILTTDTKDYVENDVHFSVSQVEAGSTEDLDSRIPELLTALEQRCSLEKHYFHALMITDITALNSVLLVAGDAHFISKIPFPTLGNPKVFLCKGILSRKKQLLPLLVEQLEGRPGGR